MERIAKDGTVYRQVGQDEWEPITRKAKDGTVYKKVGQDEWEPLQSGEVKPVFEQKSNRPFQAMLEGAGNAMTFGYLPQLQAMAQKPLRAVYETVTGNKVSPESYTDARDAFIRRSKGLVESNPGAYTTGAIAGSVALPVGAGAKAATTGGKLLRAATTGALTGAAYNPGDTEGEISGLQLKDRAKQAAIGAGAGALGQAVVSGAGKAAQAWANKGKGLKKASDMMAVTSAGGMTGEVRKLLEKDQVRAVGEFLKKEKLIGPGKTVSDTLEGAQRILDETGPQIKNIYAQVQAKLQDPQFLASLPKEKIKKVADAQLSPYQMADELSQFFEKELKGKAGGRRILATIQNELENLRDIGRTADLQDVLTFRRGVDDLINYDKSISDLPGAQQALKKMRDYLVKKTDAQVSAMDELVGGDSLKALKALNRRYWGASEAESIARRAVAREESKMILGLPELIVGGSVGGASAINDVASGRPEDVVSSLAKGAAAGALLKGARKYGPGLATVAADRGANILMSDPTRKAAQSAAGLLSKAPAGLIGQTSEKARRKPKLNERSR